MPYPAPVMISSTATATPATHATVLPFPAAHAAPARLQEGEATACLAVARVLVIDDEAGNVRALTQLLETAGVGTVLGCSEPAEALQTIRITRPDLLLLDLRMPEVSGFDILTQLSQVVPPGEFLPVLVLTGDGSRETRTRALAAGANDFLAKPFDRQEVELRVRNLLLMRGWHQSLRSEAAALEATVQAQTRDLRLALQRAEHAAAAKTAFLATISSELRAPLSGIVGFAQVLGRNKLANLTTDDLAYASRVEHDARQLMALLDDVLDLARLESGRLPLEELPVAVTPLLRRVAGEAQRGAGTAGGGHGVPVHLSLRDDVALRDLMADPARLAQLLHIVISNAVKFTSAVPDGVVVVKALVDDLGSLRRVDVLDSGVGMPPEELSRVLDSFAQGNRALDRQVGAAGLHVALARALARAMGFRLTAVSREGHGTCVSLLLDGRERPYASLEEARAARADTESLAEQRVAQLLG